MKEREKRGGGKGKREKRGAFEASGTITMSSF